MEEMYAFLESGRSRDLAFRIENLLILKQAIQQNQPEIEESLLRDLGKCPEEAFLTEISIVLDEIDYHVKHLREWARPTRVKSGITLFPSKCNILYEPFGLVLIIAPWNYPFQLLLDPLVGALSAGNAVVLKPSHQAPETAKIVKKIVTGVFDPAYVRIVEGAREELDSLLDQRFDYIFFTGSPNAGRYVMEKAARHLCPVTLELGGKSPCIVSADFDVDLAARRIAFGKFINAGQTCVAPDYILVEKGVKESLIKGFQKAIRSFYGKDPKESDHYGRIVNDRFFDRLEALVKTSGGSIVIGGETEKSQRYFAPTLIDQPDLTSNLMQEEIFGPLLPILEYETIRDAVNFVNAREKPLALYYFGEKTEADYVLKNTSSGGACVNDTILHVANKHLPFGGVGESGMGKYHGKSSFYLFSNHRSVVTSSKWFDLSMKYAPYRGFKMLKKMV
jgi:aldehyde dehydrogenase (NAD+)